MYVLTIKFNPTATKTYDYLLVNPKGTSINTGRPLRIITGSSHGTTLWKELTVVNTTKMDRLPDWVTAQIVLDENNICSTEKISAAHVAMLRGERAHAQVRTPVTISATHTMATSATETTTATMLTKKNSLPAAIQAIIDRQRRARQESVELCRKLFNN